jgi:hypothetical protein
VVQFATIVVLVRSIQVLAKDAQRLEFTRRLREGLLRSGRQASPVMLAREINLHLRASERVHASSCRKWLFAEAIPTQEKLLVLAQMLQVSASWLRFGHVNEVREPIPAAAPLSQEELALLETWRGLAGTQRRAVLALLKQMRQPSP